MAPFKGYWMTAGYCTGAVANDMTVADYVRKTGGTAGTSGTGGVSGRRDDGASAVNDLHNSNGTPKGTNGSGLQTYFPNRFVSFPRATLESWWPGSGWWPDYNTDTALMGTTIDTAKLDQIALSAPDGTLFCTDVEYSTQCPGPTNGNDVTWVQDRDSEDRATFQIGMEGTAFTYFKAVCTALGKPNIKLFKYVSFPFTQSVTAGSQFYRDTQHNSNAGLLAYATLCDRYDAAFAWAIANGAYSSQVCDGLLVDAYLPYDDTAAAGGFGSGFNADTVLLAKMSRDARLIAQLKVPCYALIMGKRTSTGSMTQCTRPPNLVTTAQFQKMIDYGCAGYDGVVWYSENYFVDDAAVASGNFTMPAWDTAIELYGPRNFFTTAQSIATR